MKTLSTANNKNKQITFFTDQENEYVKELVKIIVRVLLTT